MPVVTIPLGQFSPDSPDIVGPGPTDLSYIKGLCDPFGRGLRILRKDTVKVTHNLSGSGRTPNGALYFQTRAATDPKTLYWESSNGKLWKSDLTAGTTTDVTGAAITASGSLGKDGGGYFLQSADDILWTNGVEVPRKSVAGAAFVDAITSTKKPKGRYIGALSNYYILANDTPNSKPDTVFWSALNNYASFDTSATTGSDEQQLVDVPGKITGLYTGEFGLVFKQTGIWLMTYEGHPYTFGFQLISNTYGTSNSRSIIAKGRNVYFYSNDGFKRVVDRSYVEPVDIGKIKGFLRTVDLDWWTQGGMLSAGYDHNTGLLVWTYWNNLAQPAWIAYSEEQNEWFFSPSGSQATGNYQEYMFTTGPYVDASRTDQSQDVFASMVALGADSGGIVRISSTTSSTFQSWQINTKRIMLNAESSVPVSGVRLIAKMMDQVTSPPNSLAFSIEYSNDPFFATSTIINTSTASLNGWYPAIFDAQFCRVTVSGGGGTNNIPDQILALQFDVSGPGGSMGI